MLEAWLRRGAWVADKRLDMRGTDFNELSERVVMIRECNWRANEWIPG